MFKFCLNHTEAVMWLRHESTSNKLKVLISDRIERLPASLHWHEFIGQVRLSISFERQDPIKIPRSNEEGIWKLALLLHHQSLTHAGAGSRPNLLFVPATSIISCSSPGPSDCDANIAGKSASADAALFTNELQELFTMQSCTNTDPPTVL